MSYRDNRRERSRTPPPVTRGEKRGRSKSPPTRRERSRSPIRRDRNYDNRNGGGDRSNNWSDYGSDNRSDNRSDYKDSRDEFGRLRTGGSDRRAEGPPRSNQQSHHAQSVPQKDQKQTKADAEAAKKERLEMIKNITGDNDDNKKEKPMRTAIEGETEEDVLEEQEEEDMMEALGFSGFNSTKGKQVSDNAFGAAIGSVAKHKERKYRQYMNRRGGFNRPLQKMD